MAADDIFSQPPPHSIARTSLRSGHSGVTPLVGTAVPITAFSLIHLFFLTRCPIFPIHWNCEAQSDVSSLLGNKVYMSPAVVDFDEAFKPRHRRLFWSPPLPRLPTSATSLQSLPCFLRFPLSLLLQQPRSLRRRSRCVSSSRFSLSAY